MNTSVGVFCEPNSKVIIIIHKEFAMGLKLPKKVLVTGVRRVSAFLPTRSGCK